MFYKKNNIIYDLTIEIRRDELAKILIELNSSGVFDSMLKKDYVDREDFNKINFAGLFTQLGYYHLSEDGEFKIKYEVLEKSTNQFFYIINNLYRSKENYILIDNNIIDKIINNYNFIIKKYNSSSLDCDRKKYEYQLRIMKYFFENINITINKCFSDDIGKNISSRLNKNNFLSSDIPNEIFNKMKTYSL